MLHSPVTDRKNKAESTNSGTLAEHKQHNQTVNWLGRSLQRSTTSVEQSFSIRDLSNLVKIQRGYGNQAALQMLRAEKGRSLGGVLQRKCACGNSAGSSGSCAECQSKPEGVLQTKLQISEPGDQYEQEAELIVDQVMAASAHSIVSGAPPSIQRLAGQPTGAADMAAPASVDRVLSSPGSPLEPSLQQDMEQRFGHDFSQVRIHTGAAAGRSAQEVNANAYTFRHNIVFGVGQFAPGTHEGRRLLAHELTHVVQQGLTKTGLSSTLQCQADDDTTQLDSPVTLPVSSPSPTLASDDDATQLSPSVKSVSEGDIVAGWVVYKDVAKRGGEQPWRINNPGSVTVNTTHINDGGMYGDYKKTLGIFRIFPTWDLGYTSARDLYLKRDHAPFSLKWLSENAYHDGTPESKKKYLDIFTNATKRKESTLVKDLTNDELEDMMKAIATQEGGYAKKDGEELPRSLAPNPVKGMPPGVFIGSSP